MSTRSPFGRRAAVSFRPTVDSLEDRPLTAALPPGLNLGNLIGSTPSFPRSSRAEIQAVLDALRSGAGNEWLSVVMRQVPNPLGIAREFMSGARTEYVNRGVAFRVPKSTASYVGTAPDEFKAIAAGAVFTSRQRLLLGAIVDGPIGDMKTGQFVFGIDRGAPRIALAGGSETMVDATITVRMVNHRIKDVLVRDLTNNRTTTLPASAVKLQGATLQVQLNPSLLPSRGYTLGQYRFSFWTVDGAKNQIASYVPEGKTIPVAVANASLGRIRIQ
jgi:hypothetical protein